MIWVANLPALATGGGNRNLSFSAGLRGGCHYCHLLFLKERREEGRSSNISEYQNRWQWWQRWQPHALTSRQNPSNPHPLTSGDNYHVEP